MEKKKIIIIVIIIVIVISATVFVMLTKPKWLFGKKQIEVKEKEDYTVEEKQSLFPLQKGSNGNEVKVLQRYLNNKYSAGLKEDGDFGNLTEAALLKNEGVKTVSFSLYGTKIALYVQVSQNSPNDNNSSKTVQLLQDLQYTSTSGVRYIKLRGDKVQVFESNKPELLGYYSLIDNPSVHIKKTNVKLM